MWLGRRHGWTQCLEIDIWRTVAWYGRESTSQAHSDYSVGFRRKEPIGGNYREVGIDLVHWKEFSDRSLKWNVLISEGIWAKVVGKLWRGCRGWARQIFPNLTMHWNHLESFLKIHLPWPLPRFNGLILHPRNVPFWNAPQVILMWPTQNWSMEEHLGTTGRVTSKVPTDCGIWYFNNVFVDIYMWTGEITRKVEKYNYCFQCTEE